MDKTKIHKMWIADQGDGTYTNPILYTDYSDPDAIRVGEDYFMIASSFCNTPAVPLLHSKDLVNWKVINYIMDKLPFEYYDKPDYQGHSVVNYTVSEDFTRITEFKYLTGQQAEGTTIVKEYPFAYTGAAGEIPYYSIANEANQKLYEQYRGLVEHIPNVWLLGRLAEYKYYNIDAMVLKALELTDKIKKDKEV